MKSDSFSKTNKVYTKILGEKIMKIKMKKNKAENIGIGILMFSLWIVFGLLLSIRGDYEEPISFNMIEGYLSATIIYGIVIIVVILIGNLSTINKWRKRIIEIELME